MTNTSELTFGSVLRATSTDSMSALITAERVRVERPETDCSLPGHTTTAFAMDCTCIVDPADLGRTTAVRPFAGTFGTTYVAANGWKQIATGNSPPAPELLRLT